MHEASGSRHIQPVGSVRAPIADSLHLPTPCFLSVHAARPNPGTARTHLAISRVRSLLATPKSRQPRGCRDGRTVRMTFGLSCLCHRGVQNELMDR